MKKITQLTLAILMIGVFNIIVGSMFAAYTFFNGVDPTHNVMTCIAMIITSGLLTSMGFQYLQYRYGFFLPIKVSE